MADDTNISSSGKRVDSQKSSDQAKRLAELEKKKAEDAKKAEATKAARKKTAEEEAKAAAKAAEAEAKAAAKAAAAKAKANQENLEKLGAAALSIGGAVVSSAAANAKAGKSPLKGIVIGVAVIAALAVILLVAWPRISALFEPEEPAVTVAAQLEESVVMRDVKAEMGQAILGEARQKRELVVWEQDVQVDSEISTSLANLAIFSKTKVVHSFGTGVYTVDMGQITDASIAVDEQAETVTMSIPHTQLQYITKDLEATQFEDTQRGLLGFGDVKLTQEQQNLLEQSIEDAMRAELETEACFADADAAALLEVYDVYQPLVAAIDESYTLEVEFAG